MGNCFRCCRRREDEESPRLINCNACQLPCAHVDGQAYLKCLQCADDLNFCRRCYLNGYHHKSHVHAWVDNDCRHEFIRQMVECKRGWPILTPLPVKDRRLMFPLKCMNSSSGGGNSYSKKRCPNPVSWVCLQCPTTFSLCHSCTRLPFQHSHHVFVTAYTNDFQRFITFMENCGILPLP